MQAERPNRLSHMRSTVVNGCGISVDTARWTGSTELLATSHFVAQSIDLRVVAAVWRVGQAPAWHCTTSLAGYAH